MIHHTSGDLVHLRERKSRCRSSSHEDRFTQQFPVELLDRSGSPVLLKTRRRKRRSSNSPQAATARPLNHNHSTQYDASSEAAPFYTPAVPALVDQMTDDDLMIAIQSGQADAFPEIVNRYQGLLIGFFMKNTRDVQLAEDLAQETLLKIYNQSWDYLPLGRFRGWMFRIARNLLIDDVRRKSHDALVQAVKRQSQTEEVQAIARLAGDLIGPETAVEQSEFAELIDEVLAEIPEDQRQTFMLHHYSDLSLSEVAEIMEVSLATSKSRLRLAREKLAEKLRTRGISLRVAASQD